MQVARCHRLQKQGHKTMNKIIFGLLTVIVACSSSAVIASYGVFSEDKSSVVDGNLDRENLINKQVITHLSIKDKYKLANYEKQYLKEYQRVMQHQSLYEEIYIQPINKAEACKIWVFAPVDFLQTARAQRKNFWDGACKNGYADRWCIKTA